MPSNIILFNKPFGVLCQFTDANDRPTLADYISIKNIYAAGRLDKDSEGLVVLTDDGKLQHRIAEPKYKQPKTYWVQVEGSPDINAIKKLCNGVTLKDGKTKPALAQEIPEPETLWPRTPPIRQRKQIPTTWLSITLTEGRNRQVRRMTAAIGFPTLRLIRYSVGDWTIKGLSPGMFSEQQNNAHT